MTYKAKQRKMQTAKLYYINPALFNNDKGFGDFDIYKRLMFVLINGENNFFKEIVQEAVVYFKENDISWWGDNKTLPSGHLLSSQIQCLNFLFALRKDKEAILKIAQLFDATIDDIHPTIFDKDTGYIAFEFICDNAKLLGEDDASARRGEFCTSIDAFIIGLKNEKKILIPLEWKFTEEYLKSENKALEPRKGKVRQSRYNHLIAKSSQLKNPVVFEDSIYYYEPFYELMRQTLLVEQMIANGIADDYIHTVVIPSENKELLENNYTISQNNLESSWRNHLLDQTKFKIIDSKQVRQLIENLPEYANLSAYLNSRY